MTSASDAAACSGVAGGLAAGEEKAAWYREVLDLEPGSKVFLPFARLLLELGRTDEAVSVLRDGLERHPEFMEARMLLIDVLHRRGDSAACGGEVARLAGLFRSHPDFWEAWGDVSASAGGSSELTVSLGFLGALFRNEGLTLADVLAAGLRALRENPGGRDAAAPSDASPAAPWAGKTATPAPRSDAPPLLSGVEDGSADRQHDASPDISLDVALPETAPRAVSSSPFAALTTRCPAPSESPFIPGDGQEKCSLRTRSMAEVLAEQGDVRGAVDIYEELLASCRPEDRAALVSRLEDLRARLGAEGGASPVPRASAPARTVPPARNGVLDLLEKLAVRLETKARQ